MRENGPRIIASYKRTGYEAGLKVGKAEGKVEVARILKANGMPLEQVHSATGISITDLETI